MASKVIKALGSDVRNWATEQGMEVGKRGRFTPTLIKAFNEAHKGSMRYTEGNVKTIPLKVKVTSAKTGKVRTEVRDFTPAEVRDLASQTEGLKVAPKGPFSKAVLSAAAENFKG